MKRLPLLLVLLCCETFSSRAEPDSPRFKLTGIIDLPGYKGALLESEQPNNVVPPLQYFFLLEGQRTGELRMAQIDAEKGIVQFKASANEPLASLALVPGTEPKASGHPAIQLQNAPLVQVADLYGRLVTRTVLTAPHLPDSSLTWQGAASSQAEAARAIKKALNEKGLIFVNDGTKFILVVPEAMKFLAAPHAPKINASPPGQKAKPNRMINVGEIDMTSVPVEQVLDMYLTLVGRKIDPAAGLPRVAGAISLKTYNPLTKEEVVYALDTLLAWNNVKVTPVGKDLAKVEWISPPESAR